MCNKAGSDAQGADDVYLAVWIIPFISPHDSLLSIELKLLISYKFVLIKMGAVFH